MPNVHFPDERYEQLVRQAREAGYHVGLGARSQIGDYIQSLLDADAVRITRKAEREKHAEAEQA
jgi:hypothetical protein